MSLQRRRRRGANAVEFALIAPILFMIIGGVMEYGWFLCNQILLDSAAREGARAGARTAADATPSPGDTAINTATEFWNNLGMPGTPNFTSNQVSTAGEDLLVLSASLDYTGLIGFWTTTPAQVRAKVAVRQEDND